MPFQKGQSGNPAGRPKGLRSKSAKSAAEITALARSHSVEIVEKLMFWVRSSKSRESVQAAKLLLERAWGMPLSHVESSRLMITPEDGSGDKIEVTFIRPDPRLYADDPPHSVH